MPFAVELDNVTQLIGAGDDSIVSALKPQFNHRFDTLDWDDEAELTSEQALRDLLVGNELNPNYGHLYAYGFEMLCGIFGEHLPNRHWSAMKAAWIETVNDALRANGAKTDLIGIIFRGAPITIPDTLAGLNDLSLTFLESEAGESVSELREWLESCLRKKCDLVSFYY
jgi:hypothetical protein